MGVSRFGLGGVGTYADTLDGGPENRYGAGTFIYSAGSTAPLVITQVEYDPVTRETTLTWNSRPGKFYGIDFAEDLTSRSDLDRGDGQLPNARGVNQLHRSRCPGRNERGIFPSEGRVADARFIFRAWPARNFRRFLFCPGRSGSIGL